MNRISQLSSETVAKSLGAIAILYWLSLAVYLPPFVSQPDYGRLVMDINDSQISEILKELKPELNFQSDILIERLKSDYRRSVTMHYVILASGIVAGILVYRRSMIGRYLLLVICSILILSKAYDIIKTSPYIIEISAMYFTEVFSTRPLLAFHDIFGFAFNCVTIYLLMKAKISACFTKTI